MRFGAIVLAAGAGRRLGTPKALAQLGGESFLERAVKALRGGGVSKILVVGGCSFDEVERGASRLGVSVVFNPNWEGDMFSSVKVGVGAMGDEVDAFFVLPVDHPLVRPCTIRSLALAWRGRPLYLVPTFAGRRGHPPLISSSLKLYLLEHEGEGGLSAFLRRFEGREVPTWDKGVVMGVNSKEDLREAQRMLGRANRPTEEECLELLSLLGASDRIVRHCLKVKEVAMGIARFVEGVDLDLLESASLLHDLARGRSRHDALAHRFLRCLGLVEVAEVVLRHMELLDPGSSSWEQKILFLADKLVVEDELVGLEARLHRALSRVGDAEGLASARRRIGQAEAILEELRSRGFDLGVLL